MYIISIGCNCEVADFLRANQFRHQSFPFDWIWSSIEFILQTFTTDVFEFTDIGKLQIVKDPPHIGTYVFNNHCKGLQKRICTAVSVHDGDNMTLDAFMCHIPTLNAKYRRRFARLYSILNEDTDVVLVRLVKPSAQGAIEPSPETAETIELFYRFIQGKFKARITLCVVDKEETLQFDAQSSIVKVTSFDVLRQTLLCLQGMSDT